MYNILKRLRKNQKGAITVFALAASLFMITVVSISFYGVNNKSTAQMAQIEKVEQEYSQSNSNEIMEEQYNEVIKDYQ